MKPRKVGTAPYHAYAYVLFGSLNHINKAPMELHVTWKAQNRFGALALQHRTLNCPVLSREWGNGLWGLLLGIIYRDYYNRP